MRDMTNRRVDAGERADLLEALQAHRGLLLHTLRDLSDEQAARRTTVSQLCLGGLVKHLTRMETLWLDFVLGRPGGPGQPGGREYHERSFHMVPGETLAELLAAYERATQATDEAVDSVDLDVSHLLPPAPWFPPDARRSNRRVFLHVIAETAQHAGHADIIREALDGAKTMG